MKFISCISKGRGPRAVNNNSLCVYVYDIHLKAGKQLLFTVRIQGIVNECFAS